MKLHRESNIGEISTISGEKNAVVPSLPGLFLACTGGGRGLNCQKPSHNAIFVLNSQKYSVLDVVARSYNSLVLSLFG